MAKFSIEVNTLPILPPISGENITIGKLVYLGSNGLWHLTSATSKDTSTTELKLAISNSVSGNEIELIYIQI